MSERILFPASVVGSMPRPAFVLDLIAGESSNVAANEPGILKWLHKGRMPSDLYEMLAHDEDLA